jgi:hypothetical protein
VLIVIVISRQNADLLIAEIEKEVQALREKDRQLKEKKIREFREEERQRIEKAPEVPAGNKITEFTYLTKEQRWGTSFFPVLSYYA